MATLPRLEGDVKDHARHEALADAARSAVDASTHEMTTIVARLGRLTDLLRDTAADIHRYTRGDASDDAAHPARAWPSGTPCSR